jgi:hypothetical protein
MKQRRTRTKKKENGGGKKEKREMYSKMKERSQRIGVGRKVLT